MPRKIRLRQSGPVETFRCIGGTCEDTCCGDWGVAVDRKTYEKYQNCGDSELQPALHQYVTINTSTRTEGDYARIGLVRNRCPLLSEGLCSIQMKLGESYLSNTCAAYPRSVLVVDGVVEKTLHLSCPEAARLVLLDRRPFEWKALEGDSDERYDAGQGDLSLDSMQAGRPGNPYPFFPEVRDLFLQTIRTINYPRWQRLAILGLLAEEFNAIQKANQAAATGEFIERSLRALRARMFDVARITEVQPTIQMETILQLIFTRIASDFTTPRFLECYREFMIGIGWRPEKTTQELASRCAEAERRWYTPFMSRHEFMLDNFLFNYLSRTLFPYGHREINNKLRIDYVENAIRRQYLLLAAHYATQRILLIGIAAFHGVGFGTDQVVKLVQTYSKAFQHCTGYPEKALQILAANGITTVDQAVILIQDSAF